MINGRGNKAIKEWIEISQYDLHTAEAMLEKSRYLYVGFMCQQAVEKMLKALYVLKKEGMPPRTHNLLYLVDEIKIELKAEDLKMLSLLNQFYLESRYPGERIKLAKVIKRKKAEEMLLITKEIWKCLRQHLR